MRIANLNNMEVRVDVNENDIVRVNLGDTVDIEVDSYGERKFKGLVTEIANTANGMASSSASSAASNSTDAVTEFEVKIRILNSSYRDLMAKRAKKSYPFKPGMTAAVEIITDKKIGVLSVPIAAVTTRGKESEENKPEDQNAQPANNDQKPKKEEKIKELIFVNDKGKALAKEVKTGISDFENIEVLSGLKESEEIISGPFIEVSKRLKDGALVTKKVEKKKDTKEEEKP
jgi:HlyD family secretion protein